MSLTKYWEIKFKNQIDFFIISQCYDVSSLEMDEDKKSIIMLTKEDGSIVESRVKEHNITEFKIEEIDISLGLLGVDEPINIRTKVSIGRLKAMCKYFKNKKVRISYNYNDSMCNHQFREYIGKYDDFNVRSVGDSFVVNFIKKSNVIFEQDFQYHAEFTGLGSIEECNSGPYCYFKIERE